MTSDREESDSTYREITREEAWTLLDEDTRRRLGIDVEEFARRYHAGVYDDPDDDPPIMELAMRLEFLERSTSTAS
jgi:hypothetical protein